MPRIHYSKAEYHQHLGWFVLHNIAYVVVVASSWAQSLALASLLSLFWTALLAYHAYWHTPLEDGMQQRTYDRLRNRLGADWDLAASVADFEIERRKALAELRLRHVLPSCALVGLAVLTTWVTLLFFRSTILPIDYFVSAIAGYGLIAVVLQISLRWQIRVARNTLKQHKTIHPHRVADLSDDFQMPRPGMTYTVGDDGELVEVRREV